MKRDVQKGWWCRRCERVMHMQQKDCKCMLTLSEHLCEGHRNRWWLPMRVTLEATMAGANRG